jgi:hypothetical protein
MKRRYNIGLSLQFLQYAPDISEIDFVAMEIGMLIQRCWSGIHFNECFVPVINDICFRILLLSKIIWELQASSFNHQRRKFKMQERFITDSLSL